MELQSSEIRFTKVPDEIMDELVSLVNGSVSFFNHQSRQPFQGFSTKLMGTLHKLNGRTVDASAFGKPKLLDERTLNNAFLENCKLEIRNVLLPEVKEFAEKNLLVHVSADAAMMDEATLNDVMEEMFDPDTTLEPLPIRLSEDSYAMLTAPDRSTLTHPDKMKGPVWDYDFAQKIFHQLEKQNLKLDNMQVQIDEMKADQIRMWQQRQDETNTVLQKQIDDLRSMMVELVNHFSDEPAAVLPDATANNLPAPPPAPIANLPSGIDVFFTKSSVVLNAASVLMINEVVDILARNPRLDIIVTGHADRTGSEVQNLLLSQQRANAVKKFFTQSGLDQARFITKYVGQRGSNTESANDRKVTIEFIQR